MTALTSLCAPTAAPPRGLDECLSKHTQEPLRCRQLFGNRLEGRLPPSLLAMRIPQLLYALPPVSALEPATPRASCRRCSLFPQEGCPLARHGREGQDQTANDFGVCVAGPVRPLVAVPIGRSLQHAHKAPAHKPTLAHRREPDREIGISDARPNAVAPAMSAAASGGNSPIFRPDCCIINGHCPYPLSALCLVLSPQNIEAARRKREQQPCVYSYHSSMLGHGSYCTTTHTPAHIGGLGLLSPLPMLVSSAQLLALLFAVVEALMRTRLCTR